MLILGMFLCLVVKISFQSFTVNIARLLMTEVANNYCSITNVYCESHFMSMYS